MPNQSHIVAANICDEFKCLCQKHYDKWYCMENENHSGKRPARDGGVEWKWDEREVERNRETERAHQSNKQMTNVTLSISTNNTVDSHQHFYSLILNS